jgi:hypothetical protein
MYEFLTRPEIQDILIKLLIAVINVIILGIGYLGAKWAKANVSQKNMDLAINVAQVAVGAAEQLADAGKIEYKKKFETAIALARDQAAKYGLKFTDEQWKALLEASVKAMKDAGEEIKTAPEDQVFPAPL